MKIKRFNESELKMQWVSDFGMTLELFSEDEKGSIDQSISYPLLKIVSEDSDERQYLQFDCTGKFVEIPISILKSMFDLAEKEVRSETWFKNNVFNKTKD
jgi:hypothetical protein